MNLFGGNDKSSGTLFGDTKPKKPTQRTLKRKQLN